MSTTRIALDVMGGDRAPDAIVEGALLACSALGGPRIAPERLLLVGDRERIEALLEAQGGNPGFGIRHATQVIEMGEKAAQALRAKPDSSIGGCVAAVKAGEAGALVGMGNTGACVGAATLGLGTLAGVRRPGIAVTLELSQHPVTILDMGANVSPKPQHLCQYGVMGSVYMQNCLGVREPRIGLLNIGEETSKGTDLLKETWPLLDACGMNFVGNIEGGDIFENRADVVVTDGFTGNVILKLLEGFAGFLLQLVLAELKAHDVTWSAEALSKVRANIDYAEYGGALLLGVDGVVVIGHGRSDKQAVANALALACRTLDASVNAHIIEGLAGPSGGVEAAS